MTTLIDTHCHLTHARLAGEAEAVVARAASAGIARMITIGTGVADAQAALALSRRFPGVVACSAGLDPFACHDAGDRFPEELRALEALLSTGGFCALGEIGLEYHHPLAPRPAQREHLDAQLALARRLDLPVVIHCRDAHDDMLACLGGHRGVRGVIHSFDGTAEHARAYLALGWHIAFNGMVTFKPKDYLRAAATVVPADRLLIETDSPFLAPAPHRGERCEPALVVHTLRLLAELRGQREEDVAAWTTRNASALFGFAGA